MKKLVSLFIIALFLGANIAAAEGTDFSATSPMGSSVMNKNFKASAVQQQNTNVYFQKIDL